MLITTLLSILTFKDNCFLTSTLQYPLKTNDIDIVTIVVSTDSPLIVGLSPLLSLFS